MLVTRHWEYNWDMHVHRGEHVEATLHGVQTSRIGDRHVAAIVLKSTGSGELFGIRMTEDEARELRLALRNAFPPVEDYPYV